MTTASIIYWYDEEHMPRDGGGLRVLEWKRALEGIGIDARIDAIHPGPISDAPPSVRTRLKRKLAPMPFSRAVQMPDADIVVATVPGAFSSLAAVPAHGRRLIFDWMDLWSTNALTMGRSSLLSTPGGHVQSRVWARRERDLPGRADWNAFAGFADRTAIGRSHDVWLPTPFEFGASGSASPARRISSVGFIGNLSYQPNEFSLRWFLEKYSQRFTASGIEIVIAGFGSERVRSWGFDVTVLGLVPDVSAFYSDIDAAIVPIRHGGGLKTKAVEALAYGVPVIGTAHVRQGFPPDVGARAILDLDGFLENPSKELEVDTVELAELFARARFDSAVARMVDDLIESTTG